MKFPQKSANQILSLLSISIPSIPDVPGGTNVLVSPVLGSSLISMPILSMLHQIMSFESTLTSETVWSMGRGGLSGRLCHACQVLAEYSVPVGIRSLYCLNWWVLSLNVKSPPPDIQMFPS